MVGRNSLAQYFLIYFFFLSFLSYLFRVNSELPCENVQSVWYAEQQSDINMRLRLYCNCLCLVGWHLIDFNPWNMNNNNKNNTNTNTIIACMNRQVTAFSVLLSLRVLHSTQSIFHLGTIFQAKLITDGDSGNSPV